MNKNTTERVSIYSLKPFLKMLEPHIDSLILGGLLTMVTLLAGMGLLSLSGGFLTGTAIAGLSITTALEYNFFLPAAGVRFFAILRTVSRWGERVLNHNATFKLLAVYRGWLFTGLAPLTFNQLYRYHGGTLLNRITKDIDALDNLYVRLLLPVSAGFILSIVLTAFLTALAPALLIPSLILILVSFVIMPIVAWNLGKNYAPALTSTSRDLRINLLELVDGLETLSLNRAAWQLNREQAINTSKEMQKYDWRLYQRSTMLHNIVSVIVGFMAILALFLLSYSGLNGVWIAAITLLFLAMGEMLIPLPDAWLKLPGTAKSAKDLYDLQNQKSEIVFKTGDCAPMLDSSIQIENLSFAYDKNITVLQNINLSINSACHCLIQGASGGGKTTLMGLLSKQLPMQDGTIKCGGINIEDFSEDYFRSQIAVAPQDCYLFNDTLANNLRIADPNASDDKLWQVLKLVGLYEQVQNFNDKLETWVNEAGTSLSGGQKRRIGIARTLLVDSAQIYILDEPTEGLDLNSERELIVNLTNYLKGKTLIWISHRSTNRNLFDRRIVLSEGKIIA